jgi:hypothetical protein
MLQSGTASRRPYSKPVLCRAPTITAVMAVAPTVKLLSITKPSPSPECWVARAVYGAGNPRWLLFRDWLRSDAPRWFARAYLRHGERVGRVVARSGLLRRALRPLMDRAIRARFGL